jgi:hypothetical protein
MLIDEIEALFELLPIEPVYKHGVDAESSQNDAGMFLLQSKHGPAGGGAFAHGQEALNPRRSCTTESFRRIRKLIQVAVSVKDPNHVSHHPSKYGKPWNSDLWLFYT